MAKNISCLLSPDKLSYIHSLFRKSCLTSLEDATIVLINLHTAATATPRDLISMILFFTI